MILYATPFDRWKFRLYARLRPTQLKIATALFGDVRVSVSPITPEVVRRVMWEYATTHPTPPERDQ